MGKEADHISNQLSCLTAIKQKQTPKIFYEKLGLMIIGKKLIKLLFLKYPVPKWGLMIQKKKLYHPQRSEGLIEWTWNSKEGKREGY